MKQHTLALELENWQTTPEFQKSDANILRYCRTALKDYALVALGYQTSRMKTKEYEHFRDNTSVAELIKKGIKLYEKESKLSDDNKSAQTPLLTQSELLDFFYHIVDRELDASVASGHITQGTADNYRSSFTRYWRWQFEQSWVRELLVDLLRGRQIPKFTPRRPGTEKRVPTHRQEEIHYGVRREDLLGCAINELEEYKAFRLTGGKVAQKKLRKLRDPSQRERRISPEVEKIQLSTLEKQEVFILQFFGYYVNEQEHELSELHLGLLLDLDLVEDYVDWLVDERGCTYATATALLNVATGVAKFLNFDKTQRSDYLDLPIMLDLKDLAREYQKEYKENKTKTDKKKWRSKELTYPQLFQVVDYLLSCCALNRSKASQSGQSPRRIKGPKRSLQAVVEAYQIYLIVKVLVHAPWRQGEIREWVLGKTLLRRDNGSGQPFYDVVLEKHKLSKQTGELPRKLPTALTPDLDDWINIWRPKIVQSVQTLEGWLELGGYKLEDVHTLQQRLEAAKLGQSPQRVKDQEKYIKGLEDRLRILQRRIGAWEAAKANIDANDTLFLCFGGPFPESFGKPLNPKNFWSIVTTAIAKATKDLFGKSQPLNPHRFRHIAIKHCCEIRGDLDALAAYMNHSRETQKKYLEQIFSVYNYTKDFVDDWWEKKL
jgi:hypothetical protein